jgi:short-subunit dehydrogenase
MKHVYTYFWVTLPFVAREHRGALANGLDVNGRVGSKSNLYHLKGEEHEQYAAAPAFVARGRGTILNIASTVGISPETLNGVYGATKAYVLALSHSLQHELADKGIRIQAVLPGSTATAFWEKSGLPYQNLPESMVMSAEDMVDAALVGLDQGEVVTLARWRQMGPFRGRAPRHAQALRQFRASAPIPDR